MKKVKLFVVFFLLSFTLIAQEWQNATYTSLTDYKKHYSHNIEGGQVDGIQRDFIAGNLTDWGYNNNQVEGQSFEGTNFLGRRVFTVLPGRVHFTDFTVHPTEAEYGIGTGIYYPTGVDGFGFPFLGIYERRTMALISLDYFNLQFPGGTQPRSCVGLRIKYSEKAEAYYICGVMTDQRFIDLNMNDLTGNSKGFILKVNETGTPLYSAILINPGTLPDPHMALLSAVTDIEFNPEGDKIAFTGINTSDRIEGYYGPMAGMINLNLNLQWSNVYAFNDNKYSGVDVEFNDKSNKLLVLSNCQKYPFSIMELDLFGNVTQQPVLYTFSMNDYGNARAHIMHYLGDRILVTGNFFVKDPVQIDAFKQHLFEYQINDPNDLNNGNSTFNSYSQQSVPEGKQKEVTGYWAPENSYYKDGSLSIVGIYNAYPTFGYTLVHTSGYVNDPGCLEVGNVTINHIMTLEHRREATTATCEKFHINHSNQPGDYSDTKFCPSSEKNSLINDIDKPNNWQFLGIDKTGIHAYLNSENDSQYQISVYDLTGRKVCSETYNVKGQKYVHLNFATNNQLYLINVSNGTQSETIKVCGVK